MSEKEPERVKRPVGTLDAPSREILAGVIGRLLDGYYRTEAGGADTRDAEPRG